jgi:phage shock protein PspC (stress-responsive transcriptional regulator)
MYCTYCARELAEEDRFCSACGGARQPRAFFNERKGVPFSRPREGKKIAGVCAGVARHFELDVTLVRIVWIVLVFVPPVPGLIAYLACWIAMPKDPLPMHTASQPIRT